MLLDLNALSPQERDAYGEVGRRFEPEDALAQADRTLDALLGGAMLAVLRHDFLLEDEQTLRAARDQLAYLLRGGGVPVDPEDVPVLAGIVVTIAREAEKAAREHAGALVSKADGLGRGVLFVHGFRLVNPREGSEPAPRKVGSLREMAASIERREQPVRALRALRRARQRSRHDPVPARVVKRPAAPYRSAPAGAPRDGDFQPPAQGPVRTAWETYRDVCAEVGEEEREAARAAEDAVRAAKKDEHERGLGRLAVPIPAWMYEAARKRAAEAEARRSGEAAGVPSPAPSTGRWHAPMMTLAAAGDSSDAADAWFARAALDPPPESAVDAMALRLSDLLEEVALAGLRRTEKSRGAGEMDVLVGGWPAGHVHRFLSRHRPSPAVRLRLDEGIALVDEVVETGVRLLGYNGSTDFDCIDEVSGDYVALKRFL